MMLIASPLPAPPAAWPPAAMRQAGWHLHMCARCTPALLESIWEGIFKGGGKTLYLAENHLLMISYLPRY